MLAGAICLFYPSHPMNPCLRGAEPRKGLSATAAGLGVMFVATTTIRIGKHSVPTYNMVQGRQLTAECNAD